MAINMNTGTYFGGKAYKHSDYTTADDIAQLP
jgi:hypothetical protein